LSQTLGEDWETPGRMLEVMDAISNFTAVWRGLWLNDPTPQVLTKLMINVNYGAQIGEDEKGQARYFILFFCLQRYTIEPNRKPGALDSGPLIGT
jgi:hypothetical protein